jgi:endonuclease-3
MKVLERNYGNVKCDLDFSNPFELLVAVILSARCKDKTVNMITKKLFVKYKNIIDFANLNVLELENYIKPVGFFKKKSRSIIESSNIILNKYNGKVPRTMNDLLKLPGVARKTANVVLANAFNLSYGIAIDTHVKRISNILNLTKNTSAFKIENDLMNLLPKHYWIKFPLLLQKLGKENCKAKHPIHNLCPISSICPQKLRFTFNL